MASRRWPPAATALDALIEEAIVDAYGDDEQRVGFLTMLEKLALHAKRLPGMRLVASSVAWRAITAAIPLTPVQRSGGTSAI